MLRVVVLDVNMTLRKFLVVTVAGICWLLTRIEERADKSFSTQVFHSMDIGATRMDETGVVEILCTET